MTLAGRLTGTLKNVFTIGLDESVAARKVGDNLTLEDPNNPAAHTLTELFNRDINGFEDRQHACLDRHWPG